jgi:AcrR family transcriptional regulator
MTAAPTTDRGRATREQILEAASELFYRQGVTATGLDQIAAASGTGKGQLYHYFAGKRDLTHAVIERQVASVMAHQQPRLDAVATRADLRGWADALVEAYEGDHPLRCPIGALAAELAENDPEAREALQRGFGRWTDALAEAYEGDHPLRCPIGALAAELAENDPEAREALQRGFGRWTDALASALARLPDLDADPRRLATALLSAYQGGLLLAQVRGEPSPLRDALDLALRALR